MRRPRRVGLAALGAAGALALALAACSSGSSSSPSASGSATATGTKVAGGTATIALPPSVTDTFIWPFIPLDQSSTYDTIQWQWLMYRPLYMFGDNGQSVAVNYPLSPAEEPVYSDGGKTVTIRYRLSVPKDYDKNKDRWPAMVFMDGGGGAEWDAVQLVSPESGNAVLFTFAGEGAEGWSTVRLQALQPDRRYIVRTIQGRALAEATGAELMADGVQVPRQPATAANVLVIELADLPTPLRH